MATINVNTTTNSGNSIASISDTYDYTETYGSYSSGTNALTAIASVGPYHSGPDVLIVNAVAAPALAPLVGSGATSFNFYLADPVNHNYPNSAAYVQSISLYNGCYIIQTQSANPQFVYTAGSVWELLIADVVSFTVSTDNSKKTITLSCDTSQSLNGVTIDYQTNIFL